MHPIAEKIQSRFPEGFLSANEWRGDLAISVKREALHDVCEYIRKDPEMDEMTRSTS